MIIEIHFEYVCMMEYFQKEFILAKEIHFVNHVFSGYQSSILIQNVSFFKVNSKESFNIINHSKIFQGFFYFQKRFILIIVSYDIIMEIIQKRFILIQKRFVLRSAPDPYRGQGRGCRIVRRILNIDRHR